MFGVAADASLQDRVPPRPIDPSEVHWAPTHWLDQRRTQCLCKIQGKCECCAVSELGCAVMPTATCAPFGLSLLSPSLVGAPVGPAQARRI